MKYYKIIPCALVLVIGIAGCDTEELHELNVNPQTVDQINVNFLFTSAELGAASAGSSQDNRYIDWRTNIGHSAYAIQHLACGDCPGGISPGDKYTHNAESASAPFENIYGDQLKNIAEIFKQTGPGGYDEGNKVNMRNAARILKAFLFHRLTDYYGRVPYFEANTATNTDGTKFPKYDKQAAIYADLLKELEEATAALTTVDPNDGFATADLIYGGDLAKWKKWGYSLMLRLAMRVSNVDPGMANTYVQKAVAGGVFAHNDDNAKIGMAVSPSLWVNQNGISRAFIPGDGGQPAFLSKTLVDFLKGADPNVAADDDPRLMIISGGKGPWVVVNGAPQFTLWKPGINPDTGQPYCPDCLVNGGGDPLIQKGAPNGLDASQLDAYEGMPASSSAALPTIYSRINVKMLDRDEPYLLMNYGEVQLLLAEAAERGIGGLAPGAAQGFYEAGVRASMHMYILYDASLAIPPAAVDTYLATYPYSGAQPQKLEMIGEQLWVNHFLNWWEAWSDYRRTGYPALTPTNYPGNETGGIIPTRLRYPSVEVASNPNFQDQEVGGTNPDQYTTKVWWAGGPE